MGQVKGIMYSRACTKSKSRIVNNKCMHNSESVSWRADWSKFCNRSYAQVLKENTQPRLQSQKCTKVMSHPTEISQARNVPYRSNTTHERKGQSQGSCDQPCASSKTKIMRPKVANAREKGSFQLLIKNKFSLLSQNLQAINDTDTGFNGNAPEYFPIANRQVKQKGGK